MSEIPIETDVVVMGSGVSGLAAALEASQGGARVTVFEKQPSLGGTSNFFEGVFAVGSAMQKEKYIAYSSDRAFKNFVEYNHWRVDARLVRSLINRSAENIAGLYAAGLDAGGLHAESYSMRDTSGIASAFAIISGRVAGENAAKYLKG